jgi:hypothetical protein
MNYNTWINETARGTFTPCSPTLKAFDTAFQTDRDTATCGSVRRIALAKLLKAWMDAQAAKGSSWVRSTRNATVDLQGRGTVERLIRDLLTDATVRPILQPYLNAIPVVVAPTSNAYVPGKWDRAKDQDNHWYDFIRQQKGNSCVCATIVMTKRAIHNLPADRLSEEEIRGVMALEETGNLNKGISALSSAAQTHHDWDNVGTGEQQAVNVLKAKPYAVPTARILAGTAGQGLLDGIRQFTRKKPGLIGWLWTGGGGHFTMCVGPTADGARLVIIDPWNGINYVDNTLTGFNRYQNGTGTLGVAIAT